MFVILRSHVLYFFFFFQAEDGIRDVAVTGVQTCALPISRGGGGVDLRSDAGLRPDQRRLHLVGQLLTAWSCWCPWLPASSQAWRRASSCASSCPSCQPSPSPCRPPAPDPASVTAAAPRSEEHTSELQS